MITLYFQNNFSGKELSNIVLECAKESNLNTDLNQQIKKDKSQVRHIHLSKKLNNQEGFYSKFRKFLNHNKISCCIYLEENINYKNKFEMRVYYGKVKEYKEGIIDSDKNFLKVYPIMDSCLRKFNYLLKQKLNSS